MGRLTKSHRSLLKAKALEPMFIRPQDPMRFVASDEGS